MSSNQLPSEEVAEDYKSSLEDLTFNSRVEISNLTLIAKENIHAAQAIARVIEEHIDKVAPSRKLPALYLLDSIVKNVGTPYTLFFGRNLYRTFMDAYTLVDQPIRRKLEEMLHTWKQPVPNSASTLPVFPPEMTKKIDTALIKARTAALEVQQKQMKQQSERMNLSRGSTQTPQPPPPQSYRGTPQPPNMVYPQPGLPPYDFGRNGMDGYNRGTPVLPQSAIPNIYNFPTQHHLSIQPLQPTAGLPPIAGSPTSVETLHSDITSLIETAKRRFAENPYEEEAQKRLKALLDLQNIIMAGQLPPDQLAMVKDQLYKLANPSPPPRPLPPPQPVPTPVSLPFQAPNLNLAALLATQFTTPTPPPPLPQVSIPHIPPASMPQPAPIPQLPSTNDVSSLFASLQSAGLLSGLTSGGGGSGGGGLAGISLPPQPPQPQQPTPLPQQLLRNMAPTQTNARTPPPQQKVNDWRSIDVELNSASLKIPRPHLIPLLYDAKPNLCSSCARRFTDNEQGRAEKASHLDWHFRVHQRMTESLKRGQNRSWYVGEEDWIKSVDEHDTVNENTPGPSAQHSFSSTSGSTGIAVSSGDMAMSVAGSTGISGAAAGGNAADLAARKRAAKEQYIPVPNDPLSSNLACPVCKEKFETSWHADAEEWVWMDATRVGQKIYHASCYLEAGQNAATKADSCTTGRPLGGASRGTTPELSINDLAAILKSVKRKAEELNIQDPASSMDGSGSNGARVKIKREA